MSLIKSITTVGGFTLVSRIVGFVRDILIARFLGASMMADAFFVALRFPNLFRSLFAEGTLNVAFVPLFSGELHEKGKGGALVFARAVFSFLFYVLLIFTVFMEIFMPSFMFVLAPGFESIPGKLELTTSLSRITFPFLLCVSLVSLLSGVLNSVGKFWAAAFTPTLLNLTMIGALFILTPFINNPYAPAYALSIGVCLAGFLELVWLIYYVKKESLLFGLVGPVKAVIHMGANVKLLLKRMGPGVLGSGVYQINLFLDTLFVSFVGAGAISWLNYAHHMFQLPIGIIGVAIGTALLPILSKHIKAGEMELANKQINRGLEISLAMSIASMIGLVLLAHPIIAVLFERGAFTVNDTLQTSKALIVFSCGLPAYMMTKTLSPFFYARGDTVTPVKIAIFGVCLNAALALTFMQFWGFVGIAAATGITVWINAFQYMYRLKKQGEFSLDVTFKYRLPRIISAGITMGVVLFFALNFLAEKFPKWQHATSFYSVLLLGALIALGALTYALVLIGSGGIPLSEIKRFLKRGCQSESTASE